MFKVLKGNAILRHSFEYWNGSKLAVWEDLETNPYLRLMTKFVGLVRHWFLAWMIRLIKCLFWYLPLSLLCFVLFWSSFYYCTKETPAYRISWAIYKFCVAGRCLIVNLDNNSIYRILFQKKVFRSIHRLVWSGETCLCNNWNAPPWYI